MNSFNGIGRLGFDPELKELGSHTKLGMRVAINRRAKINGEWGESTSWVSVSLWNERAKAMAKLLRKGSQIGIKGELDVHEYTKKDGTKGVEVRIENADVTLCGSKGEGGQKRSDFGGGSGGAKQYDDTDDFGDDIPFAYCGDVANRDHMRGAWVN